MQWDDALYVCYLLMTVLAAAVTARPVRRVMGADHDPGHADRSSRNEAAVVVATAIVGVGMLWPITLPIYLMSRFVAASGTEDGPDSGIEITPTEPVD